jgi:hypothetical protein
MSDTARLCELLQAQAQLLRVRIAAEGTKEYKADWLKNTDTVVRDGSGKFAKKGTSSATSETPTPGQPPTVQEKVGQAISDTKKVTSLLLEGGEVTVEMLKKLLTDKNFRRRAGLEVGQTGAQAIKRLAEAAKVNPEFTKKLDSYINKFNEDLIKEYGDDGGAMAQAIRKHGNLPPGKDLKERLELHVAKYKAMEDALESPEVYEKEDSKPTESLQQKIIAASVPIAIGLATAIAPEMIFAGAAFSLTECLIAYAAGEVGVFTADMAMDKLEVNNPIARLGVDLVVGILSGGGAAASFRKGRVSRAKDVAKYSAEKATGIYVSPELKKTTKWKSSGEYLVGRDGKHQYGYGTHLEGMYIEDVLKDIKMPLAKKTLADVDAAIQNIRITLKQLNDAGDTKKTVVKLENVLQKMEDKRNSLVDVASEQGVVYKKLKDLSSYTRKQNKEFREMPNPPWDNHNISIKENPEYIKYNKALDEQEALIPKVLDKFYNFEDDWQKLYPELEDAYYEAAMALNVRKNKITSTYNLDKDAGKTIMNIKNKDGTLSHYEYDGSIRFKSGDDVTKSIKQRKKMSPTQETLEKGVETYSKENVHPSSRELEKYRNSK